MSSSPWFRARGSLGLRALAVGCALSVCVAAAAARAQDQADSADGSGFSAVASASPLRQQARSGYSLFNPTPNEELRPLSTDRPDRTESPYTVDAGHIQIEAELYNYTSEREGGSTGIEVDAFTLGSFNLKVGLSSRADLQLIFDSYSAVRTKDRSTGRTTRQRGFGDITARLKYNLFGNDGGPYALALLPFVTIPTSEDDLGTDGLEGGLIVPFAMELPGGFGLGVMTEIDLIRDPEDSGGHVEFINSITVNRQILGGLGGYVELFNNDNKEKGASAISTFDVGFTYAIGPNLQLDGGINIGLNRQADDLNPFFGVTRRF